MNVKELKTLLKENKIHFYSYWDKKRLINLAYENDLLPKIEPEKEKSKDVNYNRLKTIRNNPKKVILKDIETGEIKTFPSIYRAAKFIDQAPQTITYWGNREGAWNNKYKVVIKFKKNIFFFFYLRFFSYYIKMSWFNRIRSATSRLASNALSGARRLASNIISESVQRRITDFGNWLTGRVGPEQTPQVLNEIVEHVRANYPPRQSFEVRESNSALRNFAKVYTIDGIEGFDARSFLDNARENITRVLRENQQTKVKLIFKCNMIREGPDGEIIKPANFHSDNHINLDGTDEDDIYIIMTERILEKMATFQSGGSGWRLYSIIKLELHTTRYNPLRGETWIPLPEELANKKAIINMQNKDNKCFLWCVLRALNPKDNHPERVDKELKLKENTLNMDGIEYPVSLKNIDKFENQNPTISITVFGYNEKGVHPLRNSDNMDREHKIRLMLIEKDGVLHYCLVKNVSRLLSSQVSKHKENLIFVIGV